MGSQRVGRDHENFNYTYSWSLNWKSHYLLEISTEMSFTYLKLKISPTIKSSSSSPTCTPVLPPVFSLVVEDSYTVIHTRNPKVILDHLPYPTHILIWGIAKSHQFYLPDISQIWYYSWHYFYTSMFPLDYCDDIREFILNTYAWIQPQLWSHRMNVSDL